MFQIILFNFLKECNIVYFLWIFWSKTQVWNMFWCFLQNIKFQGTFDDVIFDYF
jgi:hypothetical protein